MMEAPVDAARIDDPEYAVPGARVTGEVTSARTTSMEPGPSNTGTQVAGSSDEGSLAIVTGPTDTALGPPDTSELIRLLASTETIDAFLHDLVGHAGQVTEHSCSITVRTSADPHYFTVASTDHRTRELDEQQYADQGGPCLESLRTGLPVVVSDMRAETRWAPYPQRAAELGAASSMSYPLIVQGQSIGALNLYAFEPMSPDAGLQARAAQLAANAAGALAVAIRLAEHARESANLRIALTSRSMIDNAVGILMGQQQCSAEEAFDLLRRASQHRNVKLRDLAAQMVAGVAKHKPTGLADRS
jgi:GAF domain-containing protein